VNLYIYSEAMSDRPVLAGFCRRSRWSVRVPKATRGLL